MAAHKGVARLASLAVTMERMRSLEVQVARGAVDDVMCSAAIAATIRESQLSDGRDALATGRREAWQVAETTRGVMDRRIERLQQLRAEREAILAEATRVHRVSRLEMDQMERMVEKSRAQAGMEETRRTQAAADDRFASRSAWMETQREQDAE